MNVRRQGYRYQRTIQQRAEVCGTGFLTGATVRLRFLPAPADTGIVFRRIDLSGAPNIGAHISNVTGTDRRTTLGRAPCQVELVEHVLAALAGLRIDNCVIELNACEPPGLDGSSLGFVCALKEAGIAMQGARREIWGVNEPITVSEGTATLTLHPANGDGLRVSYLLDYGAFSPIVPQRHTTDLTPESFAGELVGSRTFLLRHEAEYLKQKGLGARTTLADLLVFGAAGPIDNRLRYGNEPARHKALDLIGDLSLLGCDLRGHLVACRSGHALNAALARRLNDEIAASRPRAMRLAA